MMSKPPLGGDYEHENRNIYIQLHVQGVWARGGGYVLINQNCKAIKIKVKYYVQRKRKATERKIIMCLLTDLSLSHTSQFWGRVVTL